GKLDVDPEAPVRPGESRLGDRDGEAALGAVLRAPGEPGLGELEHRPLQGGLRLQVDGGDGTADPAVDHLQVLGGAELVGVAAEEDYRITRLAEPVAHDLLDVLD